MVPRLSYSLFVCFENYVWILDSRSYWFIPLFGIVVIVRDCSKATLVLVLQKGTLQVPTYTAFFPFSLGSSGLDPVRKRTFHVRFACGKLS